MRKLAIYFGHPVNTYDTDLEIVLIDIIRERFPQYRVENPNRPYHQQKYREWKQRTGDGMSYYYLQVLPRMDAGVFLPFEDGMFGAGVYREAMTLKGAGKPLYGITWIGGHIWDLTLDPSRELSIEETRRRVYAKTS